MISASLASLLSFVLFFPSSTCVASSTSAFLRYAFKDISYICAWQCFMFRIPLNANHLEKRDIVNGIISSYNVETYLAVSEKVLFWNPIARSFETQFTGQILLGTPSQKLNVLFDTGSFITWVNRQKFSSTSSSTFRASGTPADELIYLDGTKISGEMCYDTIGVGEILMPNFYFDLASSVLSTSSLENGIIGM